MSAYSRSQTEEKVISALEAFSHILTGKLHALQNLASAILKSVKALPTNNFELSDVLTLQTMTSKALTGAILTWLPLHMIC